MSGERNGRLAVQHFSRASLFGALTLLLAGCGGGNLLDKPASLLGLNKSTEAMTATDASGTAIASTDDIECPGVAVRTGAATLSIGTKPGVEEPSPLELRYQGSILRFARECRVSAGMMVMKVGVEGRVITGPAGGPGNVDVPLRIAVVQEGVTPKPITSKLIIVPVTVANAIDRVSFTHVEPEITFPMPVPAGNIDSYVVYVGFDPQGALPAKKPAPARRAPAKPRTPKQS
jgi:hypothetical protein